MRIGMMSFAHLHAEAYIQNLRAIADVEMIGLADDDNARGAHFAAQFGALQFTDYRALLAEQPDGVLICGENNRHRELLDMALAAGVRYILCEKPIATTLDDARAMVDAAQAANAQVMTAFPVRFSPPLLEAKAAIDAGRIGKILGCNAINQGENPGYHRDWFVDQKLAGGGALMDHIVHVTDALRWILKSEVREVYAESDYQGRSLFPAPGLSVETAGVVTLGFDNGAFVGLDCSWSRPNYYPTWGNMKIDFVGEYGLLVVDVFGQHTTTYSHAQRRPLWNFWGSDINQMMIAEFVASIREQRAPSITATDGLRALEVVSAAYRSSETGQPVLL